MFAGFAQQWTPIAPAASVGRKPTRHVIAGEPLVAWRDNAGSPVVLLDRCPHRSVSLSLGRRTDEGRLACAFHGWEFGAAGACEYVPFNPDAPRHRLGLWMKAANLQQLLDANPDAARVHTWNADENAHMLAINEVLGFERLGLEGGWQKRL